MNNLVVIMLVLCWPLALLVVLMLVKVSVYRFNDLSGDALILM